MKETQEFGFRSFKLVIFMRTLYGGLREKSVAGVKTLGTSTF